MTLLQAATQNQIDPRAPGYRWLTPYLVVSNIEKSITFYEKAFGFVANRVMKDDDGNIQHVTMDYQGKSIVMFCQEGAFGSTYKTPNHLGIDTPVSLFIYCDNVDNTFEYAMTEGATMIEAPQDAFWGDRYASIKDLDGYCWGLGKYLDKPSSDN